MVKLKLNCRRLASQGVDDLGGNGLCAGLNAEVKAHAALRNIQTVEGPDHAAAHIQLNGDILARDFLGNAGRKLGFALHVNGDGGAFFGILQLLSCLVGNRRGRRTAAATAAAGGHRIRRKGAGQSFVVGRISRGVGPAVSGVRRNDCVSSHIPRKRTACGSDGADGQRRVCQRLAAGGDLGAGGRAGGRCLADGQRGIFGADVGIILILGRHGVGACGLGEARAVQTGAGTGVGNIGVIPCAAADAADGGLLVFLSRAVVGQGAVGEGDLGIDIDLIHGLEDQLGGGDVRIVLAADGDGPALIRCSRDVRLAGVGEIAGCIRAREAHHVNGGRIWMRSRDLRLGRSGGEEIGCRQRTRLYTGIILQNIHRLGGSGAAVGSLGDLKGNHCRVQHQVVVGGLKGTAVLGFQASLCDVVLTHILARFSAQRTIEDRGFAGYFAGVGVGQRGIRVAEGLALTAVGLNRQVAHRDVRCCRGLITAGGQLVVAGTGTAQRQGTKCDRSAAHIGAVEGGASRNTNRQIITSLLAGNDRAGGVDRGVGGAVIGFAAGGDAGNDDFFLSHAGGHGFAALVGAALVGHGDALAGRTGLDSLKRDCFCICIGSYQLEAFSVVIPSPLFVRAGRVTGLRCRQGELLTIGYGVR